MTKSTIKQQSKKAPRAVRTMRVGGDVIVSIISLVQGSRFGLAFYLADIGHADLVGPVIGPALAVTGGLLGIATSVGIGYISATVPGETARVRKIVGWAALGLLLLIAPAVIAPVSMAGMSSLLRVYLTQPWSQWVWAVAGAMAPDLVIAGISVVNKDVFTSLQQRTSDAQATVSDAQPATSNAPATVEQQPSIAPATQSDAGATVSNAHPAMSNAPATVEQRSSNAQAKLYRCDCGFTSANRFEVAGHKRNCAVYAAKKAGQPIPVEIPGAKVER